MIKTLNIFGSTGIIGTKCLKIIKDYFPEIKINLLVANNNYKKLVKQNNIYQPDYIYLNNKSKYKNLKTILKNNKVKVLSNDEIFNYLIERLDSTEVS